MLLNDIVMKTMASAGTRTNQPYQQRRDDGDGHNEPDGGGDDDGSDND